MITQKLWESYLPGAVPTNYNYPMFVAARATVWAEQDREADVKRLNELRALYPKASEKFKQLLKIEADQIHRRLGNE